MTVTHIVLLAALYVFQIVTFVLAWMAARKSPIGLNEKMESLELLVSDLETRHESLLASHKKLNSRYAMSKAREKKSEGPAENGADSDSLLPLPGESDAEWKARMRRKIVRGELKHGD